MLLALTTGWERVLSDEGTVAHSFAQVPFVLAFLVTSDWDRLRVSADGR